VVKARKAEWLNYFLLLLLSLVWGSSYILIKKGLIAYTPPQVACLRIAISSLTFLPFFLVRFRQIDWSKFKYLAIVGLTGSFIPAFLFSFAQTEINSSMAGVLSSALSVNTVKAEFQEMDSITLSSAAFTIVTLPAFLYLWYADFVGTLTTHEEGWSSLLAIGILAVFGTVIASVIFFKLVQRTSAIFASMVSYFIPIVAILWGVTDGEPVTWYHLVGMIFILVGVYITKK